MDKRKVDVEQGVLVPPWRHNRDSHCSCRRSPILVAINPLSDGGNRRRDERLPPFMDSMDLFSKDGFGIQVTQEVWWRWGTLVVERAEGRRRHCGGGMSMAVSIPTGNPGVLMMILGTGRIGRRVRGRI